MARMPDLGQSCPQDGPEHASGVIGATSARHPGAAAHHRAHRGELDAQIFPAGTTDNEHRLIDARNSTARTGPPRTVSKH
jgi:hypothetical protein